MKIQLANKVQPLQGSAIREMFKAMAKPGMLSFAGGAPDPELFPKEEFAEIMQDVLTKQYRVALSYGITEGYAPLIEQTKERLRKMNIDTENNTTIIVSGGQQGIDLAAKTLLNEGDGVIAEVPSFIGGLNAFRSYGAKLYGVPVEEDGMDMNILEDTLRANSNIRLIYTIPTFQNPSGITMSLAKRKQLLALAEKYNVVILEDNPYGDLRFSGEDVPTLKSMDTAGCVLYHGSYSKILCPGIRVGFVCGMPEVLEKMIICKQVADVHTNVPMQMMVSELITRYGLERFIKKSCEEYGKKCRCMIDAIDTYFPENITRTTPEGGIFLWCDMGKGDSRDLAAKALERNVAIVPGFAAMVDAEAISSAFRLNYSTVSEEKIVEGIKILSEVLKDGAN